jgi:hypothetical protein
MPKFLKYWPLIYANDSFFSIPPTERQEADVRLQEGRELRPDDRQPAQLPEMPVRALRGRRHAGRGRLVRGAKRDQIPGVDFINVLHL